MQFLADECVWRVVVDALRGIGWVGDWIHELGPGATDQEVLNLANEGKCLILTEDSDFGDLIFRDRLEAFGVVRIRLSEFHGDKNSIAAAVADRLRKMGEGLIGQFTTIEPERSRQRALPVQLNER